MAETIVLDSSDIAVSRTALDITPWIQADGIDWGDAEIQQYLAEANRGQVPVNFRVPNRTIQIPLVLKTLGGTTFATLRQNIQQKVGLFQREGGWLRRITSSGGTVFCDITNATLHLGGGWAQAVKDYDLDATLTLEAIPDFYGNEIDLGDNTETTLPELKFTDTGVQGNYPGRVRIVVDEDDADTQLGLLWGFRSRHYSSSHLAALAYEAEALTNLDTSIKIALSNASGGTAVRHGTLSTAWTPVVGTNHAGTGFLTHTGSYRTWARVWSPTGGALEPPEMRFVWDVGDLTSPVENTPKEIPGFGAFYMVDLGEIRLDPAPVGTHRWQGQVQARAMGNSSGHVEVDRLFFQPLDEGAGKLEPPC